MIGESAYISTKSLREQLIGFDKGVLLFNQRGCINCAHQKMRLGIQEFPDNVKLVVIDVDYNEDLVIKYGVSKVPTLTLINANTLQGICERVGITGTSELNRIVGVK